MQPRTASGMRTEYKVDKVPFFKHSEEFRLGRETIMGRRDKKSGQQRAFLREVPEGLQIDIQLEQPFPGQLLLAQNRGCCVEFGVARTKPTATQSLLSLWHAAYDAMLLLYPD